MIFGEAEKRKVLILGAGASYGHGASHEIDEKPPLAKLFLTDPFGPSMYPQYSFFWNYLKSEILGENDPIESYDIEQICSLIEPLERLKLENIPHLLEKYGIDFAFANPVLWLKSYVNDVIINSTNWLSEKTCPYHDFFALKWLEDGDFVISFNYDLIIDSSLKHSGYWHESIGYGFLNFGHLNTTFRKFAPIDFLEGKKVWLLKPHGSVNFFSTTPGEIKMPTKEKNIYPVTLYAESVEHILRGLRWNFDEDYSVSKTTCIIPDFIESDRKSVKKNKKSIEQITKLAEYLFRNERNLPSIIAPTPYKPLDLLGTGSFGEIWSCLKWALSEAEEIWAIGFSFEDNHFNAIFRDAVLDNRKLKNIKIIKRNPDSTVDLLSKIIPSKKNMIYKEKSSLEQFVKNIMKYP